MADTRETMTLGVESPDASRVKDQFSDLEKTIDRIAAAMERLNLALRGMGNVSALTGAGGTSSIASGIPGAVAAPSAGAGQHLQAQAASFASASQSMGGGINFGYMSQTLGADAPAALAAMGVKMPRAGVAARAFDVSGPVITGGQVNFTTPASIHIGGPPGLAASGQWHWGPTGAIGIGRQDILSGAGPLITGGTGVMPPMAVAGPAGFTGTPGMGFMSPSAIAAYAGGGQGSFPIVPRSPMFPSFGAFGQGLAARMGYGSLAHAGPAMGGLAAAAGVAGALHFAGAGARFASDNYNVEFPGIAGAGAFAWQQAESVPLLGNLASIAKIYGSDSIARKTVVQNTEIIERDMGLRSKQIGLLNERNALIGQVGATGRGFQEDRVVAQSREDVTRGFGSTYTRETLGLQSEESGRLSRQVDIQRGMTRAASDNLVNYKNAVTGAQGDLEEAAELSRSAAANAEMAGAEFARVNLKQRGAFSRFLTGGFIGMGDNKLDNEIVNAASRRDVLVGNAGFARANAEAQNNQVKFRTGELKDAEHRVSILRRDEGMAEGAKLLNDSMVFRREALTGRGAAASMASMPPGLQAAAADAAETIAKGGWNAANPMQWALVQQLGPEWAQRQAEKVGLANPDFERFRVATGMRRPEDAEGQADKAQIAGDNRVAAAMTTFAKDQEEQWKSFGAELGKINNRAIKLAVEEFRREMDQDKDRRGDKARAQNPQ